MTYPKDDQFEDLKITEVTKEKGGGWSIKRSDGWNLLIDASSPVEPKVGMNARFYGKGIGAPVRGVYLDGKKVYYRTEAEEKEYEEITMYGENAADWLARWDAGRTVWSIEMGGLGPGYEQCIHIVAAEILRHLLVTKYDTAAWTAKPKADAEAAWKRDRDKIWEYGMKDKTISDLGITGAQWGAALNLATNLYRFGPRAVLSNPDIKDRHIQVSKHFPGAAP